MKKFYFTLFTALIVLASFNTQSTNKLNKKALIKFANSQIQHVMSPGYKQLQANATELRKALQQVCNSGANLESRMLRQKFSEFSKTFHFTEAFQIGRVLRNAGELKDKLYTFPDANRYVIDSEVAAIAFDSDHTFSEVNTAMGLVALEYLIYENSLTNEYEAEEGEEESVDGSDPYSQWNNLSDIKKLNSRCDYAKFVAERVEQTTKTLSEAWLPTKNDYLLTESYTTDFKVVREFAKALTLSLNFFDRQIKDNRVGVPSGYMSEYCGDDSCPESAEHYYSGLSIASLKASFHGLQALMNGHKDLSVSKGFGFTRLLSASNNSKVANELNNKIQQVVDQLNSLPANASVKNLSQGYTHDQCISENTDVQICRLHNSIKKVTDYYKNEFITAIDLGKPQPGTADPD